jgi:dephospho-CoA kinase
MILIGITGTHGAGKGTITRYLETTHQFVSFSVSEFLAAEAQRRGFVPDRIARRDIGNEYRAQSPTALMEATFASINSHAERVILEPQYTVPEVRFIQSKGGTVLAIDASLPVRYARVHVRGSLKDDVTFEEFVAAQEREMKSEDVRQQNLIAAMAAADVHLTNNGTVSALEQVLAQIITPLLV